MSLRYSCNRIAACAGLAFIALGTVPAHAGMFSDDEARKAVLELRAKTDAQSGQIAAAQRTLIDLNNRLEQMQEQIATVRGQNESLANQVATLQKSQKDYYADLDARLKKFEPQQQTVDGTQGLVQPGETDAYNAALQQFKGGDFKGASAAFRDFIARYPQSPYQAVAQYWLGNSLYAQRDYKGSTAVLQGVVRNYPTNARAPEALLAIANNEIEQGQKAAAKKTLQQILTQYGSSPTAQAAQTRLSQLH